MTKSQVRRVCSAVAVVALTALAATASMAPAQSPKHSEQGPRAIEVQSHVLGAFYPGDPSRRRVGELQFRGGLVLTSTAKNFGGLSALRLDPTGTRFIALSDKADWFTGRIVYRGREPVGLADVETAPARGPDGRPLAARRWYDTESLAFDGTIAYVGIERVNQIVRFDFAAGGIMARGQPIALPPAMRTLPNNDGLEALLIAPKSSPVAGAVIAFAERALDASGNHLGFLIGGPAPGQFTLKRSFDFDVGDAALLPGGDILVLERKFSFVSGVAVRVRRIARGALVPGAVLDGPVIFEADMGAEIDNLEAIDVHQDANGETVVTMVSDDNFSFIQRTLLLQFTLIEP